MMESKMKYINTDKPNAIREGYHRIPMLGGYPCHHGMARPWVADGRDGLQLEVSCEYIE
jgi:hypothetical protein